MSWLVCQQGIQTKSSFWYLPAIKTTVHVLGTFMPNVPGMSCRLLSSLILTLKYMESKALKAKENN